MVKLTQRMSSLKHCRRWIEKSRSFWIAFLAIICSTSTAFAAEGGGEKVSEGVVAGYWAVALIGSMVALFFAWKFFNWMVAQDEGDEQMVKIAEHVREGARAYLNRQ